MADQTRHQDQQREQRAPGRNQDRNQQNMGNRDREPAEGSRFDQERDRNQNRGNQSQGSQNQNSQNSNDQSRR